MIGYITDMDQDRWFINFRSVCVIIVTVKFKLWTSFKNKMKKGTQNSIKLKIYNSSDYISGRNGVCRTVWGFLRSRRYSF
jgi:hypothetical protein